MFRLLTAVLVGALLVLPGRAGAQVPVDTVDVTPALDTIILYNSTSLSARIVDSLGRSLRKSVVWTVRDTTAVKPISTQRPTLGLSVVTLWAKSDSGRSYVVATSGTKKDSALIVVQDTLCNATILGTLNLIPDSMVMRPTDSVGVAALPRSGCGNLLDGQNVVWSSSDSAKATITRLDSLFGRVISLDSTGTVYIKSVIGAKRDSVKVKLKGNL